MTELDKKIQKTQTDLVQSVLEAYDKRNPDRVDMLITNAFKQLKMSRFKPDQTTCISLIYLARICPKLFAQSVNIKELLKSHIRRDNGPTNIKGTKNDIILPVLAANILLACCDSSDVKIIILHRIEQWLLSNQKAAEMILNLLAALCMKSQGDQQTVSTLIDMRHHWLQYLDDNFEIFGRVPMDLCVGIRNLLRNETCCESLLENLQFLIKHDQDIVGLSKEISKFIIERPITVSSMLKHGQFGNQLNFMLLTVYNKLFQQLRDSPEESLATAKASNQNEVPYQSQMESQPIPEHAKLVRSEPKSVIVKVEHEATSSLNEIKKEAVKTEVKQAASKADPETKTESTSNETAQNQTNDGTGIPETHYIPPLYIRLPKTAQNIAMDRATIEAILTLLAEIDFNYHCEYREEFKDLLECWLIDVKTNAKVFIYEDVCMTTPYYLSNKLRQKLVHSVTDPLVELGLHGASVTQLLDLLQQFGLPVSTLQKIFKKLEDIKDVELVRAELKDMSYFSQLMEFYSDMGLVNAQGLINRLSTI